MNAIGNLSSREERLLKRMAKLHEEYATSWKCIAVTRERQARMDTLMLQGEQAVDALVEFIKERGVKEP